MKVTGLRPDFRSHLSKAAVAGVCLLIGALLAMPMGLIAVLGFCAVLGFAAFCAARPDIALAVVLIVLVIVPQYAILYLPGIPALPVSLGPLGVQVGVLVFSALTSRAPLPRPRSPMVAAFALYGAALLVATVVAGSKESLMLLVRTCVIPMLLFLAALYYARSSKQAMRVMDWLLISACVAALFAVVEFGLKRNDLLEKLVINADMDADLKESMSMFYLGSEAFKGQTLIYRCFSFFTNPLEFGTFMTMIYPFALVHSVAAVDILQRRLYACAAVICAVGVIMSFSRGPILALVLSTIGMAIFLPRLRRIVAFSAGMLVLSFAALWPVIGDRIQARLNEVDNVTARFKLWEVGARMFGDHPLFGVGLARYAKHQDETIRMHGIGPFVEYGGNIDKIGTVDNHFIQLAAETGAIGMIAYTVLLTVFFVTLYRVWRRHPLPSVRHSALALAAGGFNYLFNGITISSYVLFVITMIFTFFLALSASLGAEVSK